MTIKNMRHELISKLQIDEKSFSEYTPQQIIDMNNKEYLHASETGRALMFGSKNAMLVKKDATLLSLVDDISKIVEFTSDSTDNINSIKYLVKNKFAEIFPDFDDNAAIALGIRIRNAFNRVKSDELAIYRRGSYEWVINHIMKGITEGGSVNRFFKSLRKNPEKLSLFEKELRSYIRNRWDAEMMKSQTFHNSMVDMYKSVKGNNDSKSVKLTLNRGAQ